MTTSAPANTTPPSSGQDVPASATSTGWQAVRKCALLFGPLLLLMAAEVLLLPINTFTFRPWEAFMTENGQNRFFPFFPNGKVAQLEYGDRYGVSSVVAPRPSRWQTDSFGYRNAINYMDRNGYCFVVIGDSNAVGTNLDQSETLAARLEQKLNCPVYNAAAPNFVQQYFHRDAFRQNPPHWLVFQTFAGHFSGPHAYQLYNVSGRILAREPAPSLLYRTVSRAVAVVAPDSMVATPWVLEDIVRRKTLVQYLRARLGFTDLPAPPRDSRYNKFRNIAQGKSDATGQARWFGPERHHTPTEDEGWQACPSQIKLGADTTAARAGCRFIAIVRGMRDALKAQQTKLLVYLQPSGENPLKAASQFLEQEGIPIVYFATDDDWPFAVNEDWYWASDDGHWHPRAIPWVADLIIAESNGHSAEAMISAKRQAMDDEMQRVRTTGFAD